MWISSCVNVLDVPEHIWRTEAYFLKGNVTVAKVNVTGIFTWTIVLVSGYEKIKLKRAYAPSHQHGLNLGTPVLAVTDIC